MGGGGGHMGGGHMGGGGGHMGGFSGGHSFSGGGMLGNYSPFFDRLRKVIDQRVTAIAAMLCSHSCRASPVR